MHEPIRLLLLGTGQMGAAIARLALRKSGLDLIGAYGRRPGRGGRDLGEAIGLEKRLDIFIGNDLERVIEQARPQIAIQATCSRLTDAMGEIEILAAHGVHVISIAEEMAFPAASSPETAERLRRLAVHHGIGILGTGINPGFVLDLLPILLSSVCADVQAITAKRVNDLSPYGPSVLNSQGVGLTPEAFRLGLEDGSVSGHFGFRESIHMIAAALGWDIEKIEQRRDPIISRVRRETPFVTVEPGQVVGCEHTAVAYSGGRAVITLIHPQQIHPEAEGVETGDSIEIRGSPDIRLSGSPEIPGGEGTAALAVNMIPRLLSAPPGLYSMADLPVPAAVLGDMRECHT
jgi:4-hydroxy-tetrahydrodipicolinate reductase